MRWIANGVHRARIVSLRRRNYLELARLLSGMTGAHALVGELPESAAPYVFPLYVENPEASYQRLRAAGVPIFRWDEIWPGTPVIENDHGLDWATHVFQLGCHQDLSLEDIEAIAATVARPSSNRRRRAPKRDRAHEAAAHDRLSLPAARGQQRHPAHAEFRAPPAALRLGTADPDRPSARLRARERRPARGRRAGTVVERAFALDSARHLSLIGPLSRVLARPDRWVSWWLGAVPRGLAMIRKYRPDAIWSTYPIATAHKIGRTLHRLSGLPWIADFRDPMAQEGYPADPRTWQSFPADRGDARAQAACSVFVTPGAARIYRERYPDVPVDRLRVIENGYDEETFAPLDELPARTRPAAARHDDAAAQRHRLPERARSRRSSSRRCGACSTTGSLRPGELRVRLRASAHEAELKPMIDALRLADVVELAPPIPYRDALREMLRADGLLVLQAANCNEQIPAKVYEYLRCRRPIVGLTDPAGDTAALLRNAGVRDIARLDSVEEIAGVLRRFLDEAQRGAAVLPDDAFVTPASRTNRTRELADLLDRLPGTAWKP